MIPPRVSLDNERDRRTSAPSSICNARWGPHATHRASSVFPDGPTETGHTMGPLPSRARPEVGRGGPSLAHVIRAPLYGPPTVYTRRPFIGNARFALLLFSLRFPGTCTGVCPLFPRFPPILTVSLITGATRTARVISAYTPLFRAIGEQDEEHIGNPFATISLRYPFFFQQSRNHTGIEKGFAEKKTKDSPGGSYPSRVRHIFLS